MDKKTLKVIVAGGQTSSMQQLVVLLRRLGYQVTSAENGAQALALMETAPPHLIILAGHLSAKDGVSTQEQIKSQPRWSDIPVIMMAAKHSKTSQDEYIRFGYEGLLTPPFDLRQMNILVQEYLTTGNSKKRENLRIPFSRPVTLIHCGKTEKYQPRNLSEGGIYLQTRQPLPVGADVEVSLPLSKKAPLPLTGVVIYHKGSCIEVLKAAPGMAIEFHPPDPGSAAALSAYISEILLSGLPKGADSIIAMNRQVG